jgi:hypothetical protein
MAQEAKEQEQQDQIEAELHAIAARHGNILRPADVVEAARDTESALHACFEWDDTVAAEQHRLWQARQLIRVVVIPCPQVGQDMRVFVSLAEDRHKSGGGYRMMVDVLADKAKRGALLAEALAELKRLQAKYGGLEELAKVWKAVAKAQRVA